MFHYIATKNHVKHIEVTVCHSVAPGQHCWPYPQIERGGLMALPTTDEFLNNLYQMKRDGQAHIVEAEARGDLKEARVLRALIKRIDNMIRKKGGDLNA